MGSRLASFAGHQGVFMRHIDIRLVIGLVLVVASVAGVYALVAAADRTTAVYAASRPLAAGHQLEARDLAVVQVRLAEASVMYVDEGSLKRGAVILRPLAKGELVPLGAVGEAQDVTGTTIVLSLTSPLAAASTVGAIVDLWASAQMGQNSYGPPVVIVPRAQITRIIESSGIGSSSQNVSVEVIIPRSKVAVLLQAQANGDAISLVPTTAGEPEITAQGSPTPSPPAVPRVMPTPAGTAVPTPATSTPAPDNEAIPGVTS